MIKNLILIIAFVCVTVLNCRGEVTSPLQYKYITELKPDPKTFGSLNQPADIAIDEEGNIYVTDTINNRIIIFDNVGKVKTTFGSLGSGPQELDAPMALTIDLKKQLVYVADSSNHRIQVFAANGTYKSSIDLNKGILEKEKEVRPLGIAVSSKGEIYISDVDNNYIRAYSANGELLFKFGGFGKEDGKLCVPVGIFIDRDDKVYVVDMNNARVQIFDREGKFLSKIGSAGDIRGSFAKPKDVFVDNDGFIYVSDAGNLVVQIFDKNGNFADIIGAEKDVNLQFASPFGLAIKDNRLYVSDRWRNSIRVYERK